MIDPNNVLLRCPNGHDLQAARSDLQQDLACPVCNVVFKPASQMATGAPPISNQHTVGLNYAAGGGVMLNQIKRPAYTTWMLVLWLVVYGWATVANLMALFYPVPPEQAAKPNMPMPVTMLLASVACFVLVGAIAAIIMQLMWNYRTVSDATKTQQFDGISPGAALGLTFLPIFNFVWTSIILLKLAKFGAEGEREKEPVASTALHFAKACLIAGSLSAITFCGTFSLTIYSAMQAWQDLAARNIGPQSPEFSKSISEAANPSPTLAFASSFIYFVSAIVYAYAVRRVEQSAYDRMGAVPR